MPSESNGMAWRVAFAGTVAKDMTLLYKQAKDIGIGGAYIDAIKFAFHRMRLDPLAFGELIRSLPKSRLVVHVRLVKPLRFEFAIHEETHRVLIQRVELML